jgi:exonuclease III
MKLEKGYVLRYLGVEKRTRAKAGVGIIMDETTDTNVINKRIIRVDLDLEGNKLTVVHINAPTEDADVIEKEQFYSDIQRVIDEARTDIRKFVVMGDLNGRIGQDNIASHSSMGHHGGERTRNTNGGRMIDFCTDKWPTYRK